MQRRSKGDITCGSSPCLNGRPVVETLPREVAVPASWWGGRRVPGVGWWSCCCVAETACRRRRRFLAGPSRGRLGGCVAGSGCWADSISGHHRHDPSRQLSSSRPAAGSWVCRPLRNRWRSSCEPCHGGGFPPRPPVGPRAAAGELCQVPCHCTAPTWTFSRLLCVVAPMNGTRDRW